MNNAESLWIQHGPLELTNPIEFSCLALSLEVDSFFPLMCMPDPAKALG